MKIKSLLSTGLISALSLGLFSACDTGEPVNPVDNPNATAPSLEIPRDNDLIEYTYVISSAPNPPFSRELLFAGNKGSSTGSPDFTYTKTGDFDFELVADYNAEVNLIEATTLVLDSGEGTRFRTLLSKATSDFDAAEILEIAQLLNPPGAELSINSGNAEQLETVGRRQYIHRVTSTLTDFYNGSMAGNYKVIQTGFVISFRRPTSTELLTYRTLSPNLWLPFVTTTPVTDDEAEIGRWVYSLHRRL